MSNRVIRAVSKSLSCHLPKRKSVQEWLADLPAHRHDERFARLCSAGVVDNVRKTSGELLDLLPKRDVCPASLQEKDGMSGSFPRHHLVRIASDGDISGEDDPTALAGQLLHPFHVRCLFLEAITQVDHFVFTDDKLVETTSQLWREIIVEEESQAARRVSYSIASRTSRSETSNQWLTVSTDPLVLTLRASTRVGTPERAALGWPKLRFGLITT